MEAKVLLTQCLHLQESRGPRGKPGQVRSSSGSFETVTSEYTVVRRRPPEGQ